MHCRSLYVTQQTAIPSFLRALWYRSRNKKRKDKKNRQFYIRHFSLSKNSWTRRLILQNYAENLVDNQLDISVYWLKNWGYGVNNGKSYLAVEDLLQVLVQGKTSGRPPTASRTATVVLLLLTNNNKAINIPHLNFDLKPMCCYIIYPYSAIAFPWHVV
jgi:hypothetical protein